MPRKRPRHSVSKKSALKVNVLATHTLASPAPSGGSQSARALPKASSGALRRLMGRGLQVVEKRESCADAVRAVPATPARWSLSYAVRRAYESRAVGRAL